MNDRDSTVMVVRAGLAAADAGDLDSCRRLMHPDIVITMTGVPEPMLGVEAWLEGVTDMATAFPDLRTTILDVVAGGDLVAIRSVVTGTHRGPFHGIDPIGRRIEVTSNDFYRVVDGLIVEGWVATDTSSLFAQLTDTSMGEQEESDESMTS